MWFNSAEQMLNDVLDVIPYEAAHEGVWSPRLVTVLLETCSQLDSLFKFQAHQSTHVPKNLAIRNYFEYFGEALSVKWVVFWGEVPHRVRPYAAWAGAKAYKTNSYAGHELPWWQAYNSIKHDRIQNRREGTLRNAVDAMAGLLLAVLQCEVYRQAIAESGWLKAPHHNPAAALDDYLNPQHHRYVVAETSLFSYPAGWWRQRIGRQMQWAGPASDRFQAWFRAQEE